MPELPEVETIVQQLKKKVLNKKIVAVEVVKQRMVDKGVNSIKDRKIKTVYRRAKSIIIELEKKGKNKSFLLIHLRMTGHFHYLKKRQELVKEIERYVVVKFILSDRSILTHNSIRLFGHVKLYDQKQLEKQLSKLGPEPLSNRFTLDLFKEMLEKKRRSNIKSLLMDQGFLSGLGNIYAQEVLFHAQVSPLRKVGELSESEIRKVHHQTKRLLKLAIKHHGTTVENYVHIEGSGGFQRYLKVYHKQKCPKDHLLKNRVIGGRNTFYCPSCQR